MKSLMPSAVTVLSLISISLAQTPITSSGSSSSNSPTRSLSTTFSSATLLSNGTRSSNATMTTSSSTSSDPLAIVGTRTLSRSNATSSTSTPAGPRASCNGYAEFCARKWSNITEVAAHNAAFIKANNLASNQAVPITGQLNDGIRMIQGQTHYENGTIYSCHTSCDLLNAGPLQDQLTEVREWLDANRYDVVTLLFGNSDFIKVENYTIPIQNSGLERYAYIPPKVPMNYSDWPTLSEMILSNKRAVIFMDYEANQTAVPYILDEFTQMFETPFSPTDIDFPCTQGRPADPLPYDVPYIANHNLNVAIDLSLLSEPILIPNLDALSQVNSVNGTGNNNTGSLGLTTEQCTAAHGRPPRWLLVDYYNVGNGSVFEAAANVNNVTYNRPCCGLDLVVSAAPSVKSSGVGMMLGVFGAVWLANGFW